MTHANTHFKSLSEMMITKKLKNEAPINASKSINKLCIGFLLNNHRIFLNKKLQQFFNWLRCLLARFNSRYSCSVNPQIFSKICLRPTTLFSYYNHVNFCFHVRNVHNAHSLVKSKRTLQVAIL